MVKLNVKLNKLFLGIFVIIVTMANIGQAASLVKMENIISFSQLPKTDSVSGDIIPKLFSLNGKKLKLKPNLRFSSYEIIGGNVEIVDAVNGSKYATFPITKWPYFASKKLISNGGEEFVFIQTGQRFASESACNGLWLFGLHKGSYTIFANIDTVNKAGLIYTDISSSIEDGELKLLGFTRDRNCVNGMFKDHSAYPIGVADYGINSVFFFWDENAQWFGIRKAD